MGYTTWAPAEVAYLNELVDQFGERGHWDEIRDRMQDRFGSIRPYRKMRLDLRYRQLNDRRQSPVVEKSSALQQRTTALEALLGKRPRSHSQSSTNKENIPAGQESTASKYSTRKVAISSKPTPRAELSKPSQDEGFLVDLSCPPRSVETPSTPSEPARTVSPQTPTTQTKVSSHVPSTTSKHWLRSTPEPPQKQSTPILDDAHKMAQVIVQGYLAESRQPAPAHISQRTPRGRPYSNEEKAYLTELAARYGADWMTIAFMMQERFGTRRVYTNTSVKTAHRRYSSRPSVEPPAQPVPVQAVAINGTLPLQVEESPEFAKRRRLLLEATQPQEAASQEPDTKNLSSQTTQGSNVASSDSMAICAGPEDEPEQEAPAPRSPVPAKSGNCVVQ